MSASLTDAELAHAIVRAPEDAKLFEEAFLRFYRPMVAAATVIFGGRLGLAEDIAQETLLRVLTPKVLRRLREPSALRQVLVQATRRGAMSAARAFSRHEALLARNDPMPSSASSNELPDVWLDVEEALAALRDEEREVLNLRYFEGLQLTEIAARLHLTYSAAAQRVSRALVHLRNSVRKKT